MRNAECTPLSWAEEAELMKASPRCLSDEDEALARKFFQQYVFFRAVGKDARRCVCTSCMEGFTVDKAIHPDFFKRKHRDVCECPNCGQRATLLAMGKYTNFDSLTSRERAVQLSGYKGWLLIQAGYVTRYFDHDDLGGYLNFFPFRQYAFAPGRRAAWGCRTIYWFNRGLGTDGAWTRMETIIEPFPSRPYETTSAYLLMGAENIAKSSLRYCQYNAWFDKEYGGAVGGPDWDTEPFRVTYLVKYLAEYTRRPQLEFLVKLGYHQVASDLVIHGKPHKDILDWSASNPAEFFRLSKKDFRLFKEGVGAFEDLKTFRRLHQAGLVGDLAEFAEWKAHWGGGYPDMCKGARLAKVRLERASRYLQSLGGKPGVMARLWVDYLEASVQLRYDLSQDDVRMPRDLADRHDHATAAAMSAADEKAMKRYQARYKRLTEQFAFSADGLCVVVPRGIQDIVREGKLLRHCVGGYADRHVAGSTTILFLRKASAPGVPYVTIELSTENNCKDLRIRQIHGYRNELDGSESPHRVHAGFLKKWMDWVHAGSPRDAEGRPVVMEKKRKESVA